MKISNINYWPRYCEENIWHLCQHPDLAHDQKIVVFISNEDKSCALWRQKAAESADTPVIWDYHVVLLVLADTQWQIWDLDSTLALGCPAGYYLAQTFPPIGVNYQQYLPLFHLIDSAAFVSQFSFDRDHMRDSEGRWISEPPPWPAHIVADGVSLAQLIDTNGKGVFSLALLKKLIGLVSLNDVTI